MKHFAVPSVVLLVCTCLACAPGASDIGPDPRDLGRDPAELQALVERYGLVGSFRADSTCYEGGKIQRSNRCDMYTVELSRLEGGLEVGMNGAAQELTFPEENVLETTLEFESAIVELTMTFAEGGQSVQLEANMRETNGGTRRLLCLGEAVPVEDDVNCHTPLPVEPDDGRPDPAELAPLIEQYGFEGTFEVTQTCYRGNDVTRADFCRVYHVRRSRLEGGFEVSLDDSSVVLAFPEENRLRGRVDESWEWWTDFELRFAEHGASIDIETTSGPADGGSERNFCVGSGTPVEEGYTCS